jgi:glucose-1-phosphate thymidylyltransferase
VKETSQTIANFKQAGRNHRDVIGLVPASGQATRITPLPCSKELYPVGFRQIDEDENLRPKVVCHYLLEKMQLAGISKAYIILRKGKWDIPAYLGDGKMLNMDLAYLIMHLPFGAPYTIDQAYPFVQDVVVAFGFPDILFKPDDAFVRLLKQQADTNADIVLGLFPVEEPQKYEMVDMQSDKRIRQIERKPVQTHLQYTWIIAVWTPVFTQFMHEYLFAIQNVNEKYNANSDTSERKELFVGNVIQAAIENNMRVEGVLFPDYTFLDIGTPDDLVKAMSFDNGGL